MSYRIATNHPVAERRASRGWSQAELARRADVPRTTVSAIEGRRLTPSVTAALTLARALEYSVEELFGGNLAPLPVHGPEWAWAPGKANGRYWMAEVGGHPLRYPVEGPAAHVLAHDGVWERGVARDTESTRESKTAATTLVVACCDPAAGLHASEYARESGFRLLVLPRSGTEALDLLKQGRVHIAGLHRSTSNHPERNAESVRRTLGTGCRLLRVAHWQEGIALPKENRTRSRSAVARQANRWALRETGSGARECLDELLDGQPARGRVVRQHAAVAQAVRDGWADAGVCVQLVAEEAGLHFLPLRQEALDFCFAESMVVDPRIAALIRLFRSPAHRRRVSELPGYDARHTGEWTTTGQPL